MDDKLQTSILFEINTIESRNVVYLTPHKILVGECSKDTKFFKSYLDNGEYQNADEAVRENNYYCFYFVRSLGELKEKYDTSDLNELFDAYFKDIYTKVYYYDFSDENDFESYFLKTSSIEEFNKKYKLTFNYEFNNYDDEEVEDEVEVDPLTKNFKLIKESLDKNILFQNEAKDKLINTLYNNFILGETNSNIIISGPSGVGKSAMLKLIASSSTQPVLYTKFVPDLIDDAEEYLDSLLLNLQYVSMSKSDPTISSVIIIDNFDKYFNYPVSLEVLDQINKFIQNGKKAVRYNNGSNNGVILDARKVTFIICGNFFNIKKEKSIPLNFFQNDNLTYDEIPMNLSNNELESNYGFSKELLETFNTHINFKPLSLDKTKKIIVYSDNSLFKAYCKKFKEQGIAFNISNETIDLISEKVYSKTNNIKNINEVISDIFKNVVNDSFSCSEGASIIVSDEIVKNNKKYQLKKGFKN